MKKYLIFLFAFNNVPLLTMDINYCCIEENKKQLIRSYCFSGKKRTHADYYHEMGPEHKIRKRAQELQAYVLVRDSQWYPFKNFQENEKLSTTIKVDDCDTNNLINDYMVPVFVYYKSYAHNSIQTCEYNYLNNKNKSSVDALPIKFLPFNWLMRMGNRGLSVYLSKDKGLSFDTRLEIHPAPCVKRIQGQLEQQTIQDFQQMLNEKFSQYVDKEINEFFLDTMEF